LVLHSPVGQNGRKERAINGTFRIQSGSPGTALVEYRAMVGAKRALKPQKVWTIRFWLTRERRLRDRARFDLGIDSTRMRRGEDPDW